MNDNQIKPLTFKERLVRPLVSGASNRLALRGKRIEVREALGEGYIRQENQDGPITVQGFTTQYDEDDFDRELVWCNHAGAESVEVSSTHFSPERDGPVERNWQEVVCDKCGAWYDPSYSSWETN